MNINTKAYWENRFDNADWEAKRGREQTRSFAEGLLQNIDLPSTFSGVFLDFGCGLGDAVPVYQNRFPDAKLMGMDLSEAAIAKCRASYGHIAEFRAGNYEHVPDVDVIVCSNVFEHLSNDQLIANHLLARCRDLYILVPYRERIVPGTEHVNSYDRRTFDSLGVHCRHVFACPGWSQYGWSRWVDVHLKNVLRPFLGRPRVRRLKQILFHLVNPAHNAAG